jgi:hypothetical protein
MKQQTRKEWKRIQAIVLEKVVRENIIIQTQTNKKREKKVKISQSFDSRDFKVLGGRQGDWLLIRSSQTDQIMLGNMEAEPC